MGVYIRGMEMPKSCDECPMFNLDIDGGCYCTKYFVIRKKDQDRPEWCPLVPVPKHGRLIDADVLEQECQKRLLVCTDQFQRPYEVLRAIALAPIIIPAEEGET